MKTQNSFRSLVVPLALAIIVCALAPALVHGAAPSKKESTPKAAKGIDAKAGFERLKSLAGNWEGASNEMKDKAVVQYKVTSAGSVLMETLAPGSAHEMVTMYHLDGDDLMLVHYCAAQNQPHMKLNRKQSNADELVFDFAGGTNIDPKKTGHMHALRLKFTGTDTVEAHWTYFKDGKSGGVTEFKFQRSKS